MIDVVFAGAGPNGLMLACELALAGVRPLVLERLPEPTTEQRANGLVGQVIRMLDRRGLYERLAGSPGPPRPAPGFTFGAFPLDLHDLPDNPLYTMLVPQRRIEQMLTERAAELGVEIRRGHEVLGLTQHQGSVTVEVAGAAPVEAAYLVGADGGHSVVRKLAGIDFPGVTRGARGGPAAGGAHRPRPAPAAAHRGWQHPAGRVTAAPGLDTALLLRPDCYVAWEGTTSDGLEQALAAWF